TALSVMRLVPAPTGRIAGGVVRFRDRDLLALPEEEMRAVRGREIAMIFQEPMTSLNPTLTIGRQLTEGPEVHLGLEPTGARARAVELLAQVGISDPDRRLRDYPHQWSGGMRQRLMIAMALACQPSLVLADEPTTALDVTIQAQILELLRELTRRMGVALLLITHNLGVVARYADRVNVMYAGRIVEQASARALYATPRHPYTAGLLRSVPRLDEPRRPRLAALEGRRPPRPPPSRRAGGRRRELRAAARRDARLGRGVGVRQDDRDALHPPTRPADVGRGALRGAGLDQALRVRAAARAPAAPGVLP